jgi:hypothetical protein
LLGGALRDPGLRQNVVQIVSYSDEGEGFSEELSDDGILRMGCFGRPWGSR